MPYLSLHIDQRMGALMDVLVGSPGIPCANQSRRIFLLDCGAQHSAIDQQLAHELGLKAVDDTNLVTPSEPEGERRMVYEASLCIEAPGMVSEAPSVRLTGAELSNQGFSGIIGRDLLGKLLVVWDGPAGTVRVCL